MCYDFLIYNIFLSYFNFISIATIDLYIVNIQMQCITEYASHKILQSILKYLLKIAVICIHCTQGLSFEDQTFHTYSSEFLIQRDLLVMFSLHDVAFWWYSTCSVCTTAKCS